MTTSPRVALITGASRGLGAVIARVLAERRFALVIGARDPGALDATADSLRRQGATVVTVAGDLTDASVRARLVAAARELGGLDLLVNNASELGGIGPLASVEILRFAEVMRVNVGAPLALTQLAIPLLAERGGLIVNISSDAATGAYPGWGPYGASKAALELVTRTLAGELAGIGVRGVSAIAVDPGDMRTRMHQEAFPGVDISDRPLPEVTVPFWNWLFDQNAHEISGQRFAAQQEDTRWQARYAAFAPQALRQASPELAGTPSEQRREVS
jgi:NAD(P)-dependent dehydrogenase (short-subunit alcohol dehydrogenase family)